MPHAPQPDTTAIDDDTLNLYGPTDLHKAAAAGDVNEVDRLLGLGAPPDGRDEQGRTALHLAAARNHADVVERLLQTLAHMGTKDHFDEQPLAAAARAGARGAVVRLCNAGADVDAVDGMGWTALQKAEAEGHADVAAALRQASASASASGVRDPKAAAPGRHGPSLRRFVITGKRSKNDLGSPSTPGQSPGAAERQPSSLAPHGPGPREAGSWDGGPLSPVAARSAAGPAPWQSLLLAAEGANKPAGADGAAAGRSPSPAAGGGKGGGGMTPS